MITTYSLMLDEEKRHPYLVKEKDFSYGSDSFNSPDAIVDMLNACFHADALAEEHMYLLTMDTAGHPLAVFDLAHGTAMDCPAGIREMFIRILLTGATCFTLAHNHPSGQVQPSKDDRCVCRKVTEAASLMGVRMLDFIIVGNGAFLSFAREGLL